MESIIKELKNVSSLIYDNYMKIASGKENYDLKHMLLLNYEKRLYKKLYDEYDIDVFDEIIETIDKNYDEAETINYALEIYKKKQLINKRICDKLNNMVLIDTMQKGGEYIPELTEPDFDVDDDLFDSEIYFEGYLYNLAMGLTQIDVAYNLYQNHFKKAAFKLVFLNDFVETCYVNNKGVLLPYNSNDVTLLDELHMISDDAKFKSLTDVQDIAMWYIDQYLDTKNKKYYQYANTLLLSLSFEDSFSLVTEYYNMLDEGLITKDHFMSSEKMIVNANDQRLMLKY